jgi:hypothetical protein
MGCTSSLSIPTPLSLIFGDIMKCTSDSLLQVNTGYEIIYLFLLLTKSIAISFYSTFFHRSVMKLSEYLISAGAQLEIVVSWFFFSLVGLSNIYSSLLVVYFSAMIFRSNIPNLLSQQGQGVKVQVKVGART